MKAFASGVLAACLISVGAWYLLTKELDYSAAAINTSHNGSVRLDPGM